jgi:hypothetical protein
MRVDAYLRERCCSYAALPSVTRGSARVASVALLSGGPGDDHCGRFARQANGCTERTNFSQQRNRESPQWVRGYAPS